MQKSGIVSDLLFPSDQDATTTIHPALASLDHPASRRFVGVTPSFLSSRANVWRHAPESDRPAQPFGGGGIATQTSILARIRLFGKALGGGPTFSRAASLVNHCDYRGRIYLKTAAPITMGDTI